MSAVFSVSTSECYILTSFVSVSSRLLETDDTAEGKMNSPLSTKSNLLLFHRLFSIPASIDVLYFSFRAGVRSHTCIIDVVAVMLCHRGG